jgi:putative membrane protein
MRLRRLAGLLFRVAIVAALIGVVWSYRGRLSDVAGVLGTAGWLSVVAMGLWHLMPLAICGLAQRSLVIGGQFNLFVLARWIRESVSELASFLPLSGEVAVARVLTLRGFPAPRAAALAIVDLTAEGLAQFAFIAIGVILWFTHHPPGDVGRWALIALAVGLPLIVAFLFVQRSGMVRFVETLPARMLPKTFTAPEEATGTLAAIQSLYADRGRLALCSTFHLAAWLIASGEAAIALWFLGRPLPIVDIVAMEAFVAALRGAAFFIPGALGVQEGTYIAIGAALGLPLEIALAISLLKRGREILMGTPGLIAWYLIESRRRIGGLAK